MIQRLTAWLRRKGTNPATPPPDPNAALALIQRVQEARLAHDRDAAPSQVSGVYWVEYKRPAHLAGPGPTPRAGYVQLTTTLAEIDAVWAAIKAAMDRGELGYKARAATAPRARGTDVDAREIQIVTYDADDAADLARVRAALTALGIRDAAALPYIRYRSTSERDLLSETCESGE
jgi:hypothetical protein